MSIENKKAIGMTQQVNTCCASLAPEFNPQNLPKGGRRQPPPQSCHMTSTYSVNALKTYKQTKNNFIELELPC